MHSDLALKIGKTNTWGAKKLGIDSLSWGEYTFFIRAHDE